MARWTVDEPLGQPDDFVEFFMNDYLVKNGFRKTIRKGEEVWQEGDGLLTMARFIRYSYGNGILHLEAWIGLFRENALKGFMGAYPKKVFRDSLEEMLRLLHQPLPQPGQEGMGQQPIVVQVADHSNMAVPATVCAVLGIITAVLIPILGILFSGLGLAFGQKARNSVKCGLAKTAVILGTIGMALAVIRIFAGLFLSLALFL